jgi:hypothetical protein
MQAQSAATDAKQMLKHFWYILVEIYFSAII